MMMKEFYHEFEMLVRPSHRRLRRMKNKSPGYDPNAWNARIDDAMIYDISDVAEEVECVEVTMPADRLEELEQLLKHYERLEEDRKKDVYNIIARMREEERVRIKNPMVKKAYEQYLILLYLYKD